MVHAPDTPEPRTLAQSLSEYVPEPRLLSTVLEAICVTVPGSEDEEAGARSRPDPAQQSSRGQGERGKPPGGRAVPVSGQHVPSQD